MSILNRPGDGVYSVLIVLYKCLLVHKKLPIDKLIMLCAPPSISDQDMAKKTITRWLQLGLFEKNDDEEILISPVYHPQNRKPNIQQVLNDLPKTIRKTIFTEENNENFWTSEGNKSADFTRALCWMLAQDIYSMPCGNSESIARIENDQFINASERRPFQNDTRWAGFKAWAIYLGFGWHSNTFQIDPTVAIRETLSDIFCSEKSPIPQEVFLHQLTEALPVIDGGKYRKRVEKELLASSWSKPNEHELSTSLSLALTRLHSDGHITLQSQSDAANIKVLLGRNKRELRKISHITLNLN